MDQRTLAYINLYAVLGSLKTLCNIDAEAQKLIEKKDISVGFTIKNGPSATVVFKDNKCTMREGIDNCTIKFSFTSYEKFNGMIDGTFTPMPSTGLSKIGFMIKNFTQLTDLLKKYLRPSEADLKNEVFFKISTELMFSVILSAAVQVGNEDDFGRTIAGRMADGTIKLKITGGPAGYIVSHNHKLCSDIGNTGNFTSYIEFADFNTARNLFVGKINAADSVKLGKICASGITSQADDINKIIERIRFYLL